MEIETLQIRISEIEEENQEVLQQLRDKYTEQIQCIYTELENTKQVYFEHCLVVRRVRLSVCFCVPELTLLAICH